MEKYGLRWRHCTTDYFYKRSIAVSRAGYSRDEGAEREDNQPRRRTIEYAKKQRVRDAPRTPRSAVEIIVLPDGGKFMRMHLTDALANETFSAHRSPNVIISSAAGGGPEIEEIPA